LNKICIQKRTEQKARPQANKAQAAQPKAQE
jgi:hypothetical protein